MIQSDLPFSKSVESLTPVEHGSTASISQPEETLAKETSSSDDYVLSSMNLVVKSSQEQDTGKTMMLKN